MTMTLVQAIFVVALVFVTIMNARMAGRIAEQKRRWTSLQSCMDSLESAKNQLEHEAGTMEFAAKLLREHPEISVSR